jgi:DNA-directed RNA polymerase alpha subunit
MNYNRERKVSVIISLNDITELFFRGLDKDLVEKLHFHIGHDSGQKKCLKIDGQDISDKENEMIENHLRSLVSNINPDLALEQKLKTNLVDFDMSIRSLNCLRASKIYTLKDLTSKTRKDLLKFRNFGKASILELDELLEKEGLSFKEG